MNSKINRSGKEFLHQMYGPFTFRVLVLLNLGAWDWYVYVAFVLKQFF
jgi:hypothetical protein